MTAQESGLQQIAVLSSATPTKFSQWFGLVAPAPSHTRWTEKVVVAFKFALAQGKLLVSNRAQYGGVQILEMLGTKLVCMKR